MTKKESLMRLLDFFIIALITTIIVTLIIPTYQNIKNEYEARAVLEQGKLIKLACYSYSVDCYGNGKSAFDNSTESGLTSQVYKDILDFVGTNAKIYVLKVNEDRVNIDKMMIRIDNYLLTYNKDSWNVEKLSGIIKG